MGHDNKPHYDPAELLERALPLLAIIGRAHLHGGLHVADTLPLLEQCEVGAALDTLSIFGSLMEADAQRHDIPK